MSRVIKAVALATTLLVIPAAVSAQEPMSRPKVLGVAHMAIYVKDLAKTRQFYEDFLGFGEPSVAAGGRCPARSLASRSL